MRVTDASGEVTYVNSASDWERIIKTLTLRMAENQREQRRLSRQHADMAKERMEAMKALPAAQALENSVADRGGVPDSDTLRRYHDHGCALGLGWSDEVHCGRCGTFVRADGGWLPKEGS